MMRRTGTCVAICIAAGAFLFSGCSSPTAPVGPSVGLATPEASPAPPAGETTRTDVGAARVVLSEFTITIVARHSSAVRFVLAETSGISGATIRNITVSSPGLDDITGDWCWGKPVRVEPGGVLDLSQADLSYCAPEYSGGVVDGDPSVTVTVSLTDDAGVSGTISATNPRVVVPR